MAPKTAAPPERKRRKAAPAVRRQAILDAGLAVFAADGFAAAKLDDVAKRAGIAKGTIYLHFRDKQDLFEQIVRAATAPLVDHMQAMEDLPDVPVSVLLAGLFAFYRQEILGTERRHVMRLLLTEGLRFPEIAAFYYRDVIERGLALIASLAERGRANGEPIPPEVAVFPQLVMAPLVVAVLWDGLFAQVAPLDVEGLLAAHLRLLTAGPSNQ